MTSARVTPIAGALLRRRASPWSRAFVVSLALHVGWVAWAAQNAIYIMNHWSVESGANSTAAIEARFSEGDLNAEKIQKQADEIALQIPKSTERASPEDRLVTGGRPTLAVVKQEIDPPQPAEVSPLGDLPAPTAPPVELQQRESKSSPALAAHEIAAAVPRARRAPEVQVEPIEPSVASSSSSASLDSRGADATTPAAVTNPAPVYPPEALARGLTGRVVIRVRLHNDGRVAGVALHRTSGATILDEAALAAVRGWRFEPPGQGRLQEFGVPVNFVLGGQ